MKKIVGIALAAGLGFHAHHGIGAVEKPVAAQVGQKKIKTPVEIKDMLVAKISGLLFAVINESAGESNSVLQTNFKKIHDEGKKAYKKSLQKNGHNNRADEAVRRDFAYIWKDAINYVVDVEYKRIESQFDKKLSAAFAHAFDEDDDDVQERAHTASSGQTVKVKTVLLNILLRQPNAVDKVEKVRALIEMGADKNLNPAFAQASKMESQPEYPLAVVLNEIIDTSERDRIVAIMFDDTVAYTGNRYLPEGLRQEGIAKTLLQNKNYIAEKLVANGDFATFNTMLTYCEMKGMQFVEEYTEEMSQIHDQLWSPILEQILGQMRDVRRSAVSSDENGEKVDNIKEFLNSPKLRRQMQLNSDARFSLYFQENLARDYETLFSKAAQHINATKTQSELDGRTFKEKLISWVKLANFRNRVAKHLNRFAMTASNEGRRANVIRLIRYANIYDRASEGTDQGDLFKELFENGGTEIIFTTKNKLKWTPAMYAMVQKQGEGIQLLLKQALNKVTDTDGVGNNIFHLAFPLPEQFFKGENVKDSENVLELVGTHLGDDSARSKTTEAIKAITMEASIPVEDKITALRQVSSSNFTPVSLAAASGNLETYEFLKNYLLQESAWNEDDHAYLGTHVEELVVEGMTRYKKAKLSARSLSAQEAQYIDQAVSTRSRVLNKKYANCVRDIYQPELPAAVERLKKLEGVAMAVIDEFNALKATKRKEQPYQKALAATMEKMQTSKHKLLRGMRDATSMVKASYLGPIVKMVTKDFLTHKPTPHDMTFDKVYEGLTGSVEQDFFAKTFNQTIEKRMQKAIYDTVKNAGRLRDELGGEDDDNRFKHVEDMYLSDDEGGTDAADQQDNDAAEESSDGQWDI